MNQSKASGAHPEAHDLYAPGLKWRARDSGAVPYWVPPARDIKAGYVPKSLALDPAGDQPEIAAACRRQWDDLLVWRKRDGKQPATNFTIAWLISRYLNDEHSPYQRVKARTQEDYRGMCEIIRAAIGERRIDPKIDGGVTMPRILGDDLWRWHKNLGLPVPLLDDAERPVLDARGQPVTVASAPSRARAAITMFRMLIKYAVIIGVPGSKDLRNMVCDDMRFPTPEPRTRAPTRAEVDAIVGAALAAGAFSIAITTLAQFELTERRIHIIGEWHGIGPEKVWKPGWEWAGLKNSVIRYTQEKRAVVEREFDLNMVPRLLAMLDMIPANQRFGAIIKRESTGKPWDRSAFAKAFRAISRAAGVPDDVWSMDMRAGGATEADNIAEVTPRMLQDGLGHSNLATQERYRRGKQRNAGEVVRLRQAARKPENG